MIDGRSWLSRANDYAMVQMQKMEAQYGSDLDWEAVYQALRGSYLQGACDQYDAIEDEWAEEHHHPNPSYAQRK